MRLRRASPSFQLQRRARHAIGAALLAVVGFQSAIVTPNVCVQSAGTSAATAPANAPDDGMASMHHPSQPANQPTHRTNCDHDRMASACVSCAVLAPGNAIISYGADAAALTPAFKADILSSFDASPRVPPPRV
jgi:hypothetical protein